VSAHTPGPWRASDADNGTVFANDQPIGRRLIAYLPTNAAQGPNARLIAAAPDLLAALREANSWIDAYSIGSRAVLDQIQAAIFKATGEKIC
jgi:hypothetical protein